MLYRVSMTVSVNLVTSRSPLILKTNQISPDVRRSGQTLERNHFHVSLDLGLLARPTCSCKSIKNTNFSSENSFVKKKTFRVIFTKKLTLFSRYVYCLFDFLFNCLLFW